MRRRVKVCSRPGCPNLCSGGRCDDCDRAADRSRGTARERGYNAAWERTRQDYLDEYPFCSEPGCPALATDVDHIDGLGPLSPRGHDGSNLRSYCHSHHSQRTARDQPGGWNAP